MLIATLSDRMARLLYPETFTVVASLTAFLVVVAVLVRLPMTLAFDVAVTKRLQILDTPLLNKLAAQATFMGNSLTLVLMAAGFMVIAWLGAVPQAAWAVPFSLLALPLNMGIKYVVTRRRPLQEEVRVAMHLPRWGFSFPSGHAMASSALYWFAAALFYLHVTTIWLKWIVLPALLVLPLLVGLSRVYVGAHWFSDVVAGWAGGLLVMIVFAALYPA